MPQRGPLPSQRMSLAILKSVTAMVWSWPLASTNGVLGGLGLRSGCRLRGTHADSGVWVMFGDHALAELGVGIDAGADGGAADGQFAEGVDGAAATLVA